MFLNGCSSLSKTATIPDATTAMVATAALMRKGLLEPAATMSVSDLMIHAPKGAVGPIGCQIRTLPLPPLAVASATAARFSTLILSDGGPPPARLLHRRDLCLYLGFVVSGKPISHRAV